MSHRVVIGGMKAGRVISNAPALRPIYLRRGGIKATHPGRVLLYCLVGFFFFAHGLRAAEVIPPPPQDHFNDYAGVVAKNTAQQLEAELTQFERTTSSQLLVVIYPHMQSASSIEDYTVRVFEAWKVGREKISNGAVLFIFSEDRRLRIATGYGLEASLPDALCKQIIENEITPRFRNGDFSGGVAAGVHAMMAATRGEYRGTGRTVAGPALRGGTGFSSLGFIFFILLVLCVRFFSRRNTLYTRRGRFSPWISTGGWGGGGWSGGGGGGGSFSGGGGHTGGGGASGSW